MHSTKTFVVKDTLNKKLLFDSKEKIMAQWKRCEIADVFCYILRNEGKYETLRIKNTERFCSYRNNG